MKKVSYGQILALSILFMIGSSLLVMAEAVRKKTSYGY
jgi:hypothetical protein